MSSVNDWFMHSITTSEDILNNRDKHWLTSRLHDVLMHDAAMAVRRLP